MDLCSVGLFDGTHRPVRLFSMGLGSAWKSSYALYNLNLLVMVLCCRILCAICDLLAMALWQVQRLQNCMFPALTNDGTLAKM